MTSEDFKFNEDPSLFGRAPLLTGNVHVGEVFRMKRHTPEDEKIVFMNKKAENLCENLPIHIKKSMLKRLLDD